ncbi:long-chain-fatty-acid--CoA ligase 4 isoform X3 [Folsomia candida]|uniref:long-chain-fatty-acid--CoA ligase n=2 Tax=Folsomia candida TaxID=158441 RepID=A0A226EPS2_FOLCA|nr:long-chain-fatty-acid--CoA ligase 4 isoform X3 [Folsomia candida]XP_021946390.1 long-chain-fatty-acid--CoA ligase 4 isoform X3 [Folsomia candida]XP_035703947.1 long-chain-fatty-acid--CoA ligase 4 isoform X3 [Folsomia candida]OXA59054.1 Long-chain-fatty-acid--CoA ligase 4 [Folsomia candida]
MGFSDTLVVVLLRAITFIYDVLTLPIYTIVQYPWRKVRECKESKAQAISHEGGITFRSTTPISKMHVELEKQGIDTMEKVFNYAVRRNGSKRCLGSRELIDEEDEVQKNGKVFKKYVLGEYLWKTYNEVDRLASGFSKGLRQMGLEPKGKICIFAETRAEWLIAAIGCFKQNITLVTLYATLGEDAVIHGLNETECEFVLTSHDLMPKFRVILENSKSVKHLIYMEDPLRKTDVSKFPENVKIHGFCDVIAAGTKSSIGGSPPSPEDVAIIMYTSGSTGAPKGVLLSQRNVSIAMMAFSDALGPVYPDDIYLGYLPLAHVLELMCESISFLSGIPIGYSTPLTMTDQSSKIKRGCKGDTSVLRPTIMASVPLILDRIYKGIQEKVGESGKIGQALFKFFYDYKLKWYYRGFNTPLVNRLIFKKLRQLIGGRVRILASGGAPLAPDTHEFIRNSLCVPLLQGYGLTETAACATISLGSDMSTGRVGAPLGCCDIRLVNWDEGNYTIKDRPFPRGEILIGGDNVALGYYKLPEATEKDFFEEDGRRWFRSGDIAEVQEDGCFKIIDRKKDLVKLQVGEYVSLGKVESELKTCPLVDNICIYGDASKQFCVALIVPAVKHLTILATKLGKSGDMTLEEMCADAGLANAVLKEIQIHGTNSKLAKFEIPGAVTLCSDTWQPDSGLVTAAFKLKRKNIQDHYQSDINRMYA